MSTSNKKFIFTADDFGLTKECNFAVLEGVKNGALTSACVCANGEFFSHAMEEILPQIKELDLGVHLNIIEGKSLAPQKFLTDAGGKFRHGFFSLLINSYRRAFLKEVEAEFRAQIEKVLESAAVSGAKVNFLNSHVHTHAIPRIFELTAALAAEYKIPSIRLQAEKFYAAKSSIRGQALPGSPKPVNLVKVALLNYFSIINRASVRKYNLKCNDYILGVGYTGEMNEDAILSGLHALSYFKNITVEALLHPENDPKSERYGEYLTTINPDLRKKIENLGFEFASFG